MTALLLALAVFASAQSTAPVNRLSLEESLVIGNQGEAIRELQSGRPQITGIPTYRSGVKFQNTTGSALTFQDGTTQNTAAVDVIPSTATVLLALNNISLPSAMAVAYATASFTAHNVPYLVCLSGSFENSCTNYTAFGYLVNGAFGRGMSSTVGIQPISHAANTAYNASFCRLEPPAGSGTISIALTAFNTLAATCDLDLPALTSGLDASATLDVYEIR